MEAWFGRMLHAAATLTLVGEFRPFGELAASTLGSVLEQLGGHVGCADEVLQGLGELEPYPDAVKAIGRLQEAGLRIATLTNGGEEHTRKLLERGGLADAVELVITVDEVRAYKPHAAPYQRAAERLGLPRDRITLIAAHGWDVLGATSAGMRAVWVERLERRWPFPTPAPPRAADLVTAAELVLSRAG